MKKMLIGFAFLFAVLGTRAQQVYHIDPNRSDGLVPPSIDLSNKYIICNGYKKIDIKISVTTDDKTWHEYAVPRSTYVTVPTSYRTVRVYSTTEVYDEIKPAEKLIYRLLYDATNKKWTIKLN